MPPGTTWGEPIRLGLRSARGRRCSFAMLRFSTTTLRSRGRASRTFPRLPRSLPVITWTTSSFLILSGVAISEHLRRQRDDLHEVLLAQLAGHRPEDARPARVELVVDDHGRVLVERDRG